MSRKPLATAALICLALFALGACSANTGPAPVESEQQIMESLPGGEGATDLTPDAPPE